MKKAVPRRWQLQEAKSKFSEVFERAMSEGPQYVTRRDRDAVVILPAKDYEKLKKPKQSLIEVLRSAPYPLELDVRREAEPDKRTPDFE